MGVLTLIYIVIIYACGWIINNFLCLAPLMFGPVYPVIIMDSNLEFILNRKISFEFLLILSVIFWLIVGSLIGALVGHIKSRKTQS